MDSEESALTLVRKLRTTPRALWRTLTDRDAMEKWFAPAHDFRIISAETDARVGGGYRIVMRSPRGEERTIAGIYREVVPNERLSFTWPTDGAAERESLVLFELTPAGDATELLLVHKGFADAQSRKRHEQQWKGCIRRLARIFA